MKRIESEDFKLTANNISGISVSEHNKTQLMLDVCKDTDDHRNGHCDPPHLRILLHNLFNATLRAKKDKRAKQSH